MLIDSLLSGQKGAFWSALNSLILPTIVLGTIPLAVIARQTRSAMLEVLGEDYVRTARSRALTAARRFRACVAKCDDPRRHHDRPAGRRAAWRRHPDGKHLLLAGIGKWMIDAVFKRDYPVVQGGLLLIAGIVMLVNLAVDLLYGFVNPRIRH